MVLPPIHGLFYVYFLVIEIGVSTSPTKSKVIFENLELGGGNLEFSKKRFDDAGYDF